MTATEQVPATATAELYFQVQQFLASQMQLLDSGRVAEWAATFTEDGVFAANAHPEPAAGRVAITAAAQAATDAYAAKGIQRRHWLGMVTVEPRDENTAAVRSYAVVIETPKGGQAAIRVSTLCEDLLVRESGHWLVQHRQVTRDDL
ncbi:nuclear transport factor 2 family protein [Kitasatospora sp. NPDC004615]|uniref:nuclear transport factor 2 family protein n=1 Tax=Kitasatospora sp. NPDC004615 TaxID=3364017 RepID=UPI0036AEA903